MKDECRMMKNVLNAEPACAKAPAAPSKETGRHRTPNSEHRMQRNGNGGF